MMAAGLIRIGEAASRIADGRNGDRAVAHATQGPCLQQNLVCVYWRVSRWVNAVPSS